MGQRLWRHFEKVGDVFIAIFLLVVAFAFIIVDDWVLRWKILLAAPVITLVAGVVLLLYALFVEVVIQSVIAALIVLWAAVKMALLPLWRRIRGLK